MKVGTIVAVAVGIVVLGGAAYFVRGLNPSAAAIEEGNAFTAANNKMMAGMMGDAVVYSGNADRDFVMLMLPHHQGAIDMANVELKYGADPVVRAMAQKMAAGQQPEIDSLSAWQKAHPQAAAPSGDSTVEKTAYSAANDTMMNGMMGDSMAHSGNADLDFVKMMIPHHQGAIDMAGVELKYGTDSDLKAMAQAIVTAQQAEITEMSGWLKSSGH